MILIIGGSLGAKNINEAIVKKWKTITEDERIRLFWATGKDNYEAKTPEIAKEKPSCISDKI